MRLRGVEHDLVRHAVRLTEDGPQALVPGGHVTECGVQGRPVESAGQAQRERHVVGGAGAVHPVQEPQAALGEGQRQVLGARVGGQRGPRRAGAVQAGRQPGHGRGLEQCPDLQFRAEGGPDPGGQAGRQQRVSAQVEEAVLDADPRQPEHLGEQLREELLLRGARRPSGSGRAEVGSGQRPAVELAAGRQRERLQRDERRRDQVVGQPPAQPVAEFTDEGAGAPAAGRTVGQRRQRPAGGRGRPVRLDRGAVVRPRVGEDDVDGVGRGGRPGDSHPAVEVPPEIVEVLRVGRTVLLGGVQSIEQLRERAVPVLHRPGQCGLPHHAAVRHPGDPQLVRERPGEQLAQLRQVGDLPSPLELDRSARDLRGGR